MGECGHPAESLYNLIPREEPPEDKPPRYTSIFREQVKLEKKANKAPQKTMGPARVDPPEPGNFLQKHSKEPRLPDKKPFKYEEPFKPPVPSRVVKTLVGVASDKDFIKTNVVENITAVPRKPRPALADTKNGDKKLLENSGLVPKYVNKKSYGQTPEYLLQRKEQLQKARDEYDTYLRERQRDKAMNVPSEEERSLILQGLKKNWEELHFQYQGMSVVIDTVQKRARKERLEQEMMQLEKDIDLIEQHKTIYIVNNL